MPSGNGRRSVTSFPPPSFSHARKNSIRGPLYHHILQPLCDLLSGTLLNEPCNPKIHAQCHAPPRASQLIGQRFRGFRQVSQEPLVSSLLTDSHDVSHLLQRYFSGRDDDQHAAMILAFVLDRIGHLTHDARKMPGHHHVCWVLTAPTRTCIFKISEVGTLHIEQLRAAVVGDLLTPSSTKLCRAHVFVSATSHKQRPPLLLTDAGHALDRSTSIVCKLGAVESCSNRAIRRCCRCNASLRFWRSVTPDATAKPCVPQECIEECHHR